MSSPCNECRGTGKVKEKKTLRVKIPAGARSGSKLRVPSKGSPGYGGGSAGDLYLNITVKPHATFKREGNDLRCNVDVDIFTAVLGGEVQVPTLDGNVSLKIPAGTSGGKTFRLRDKGMPDPRRPKQHGNLLATIRVHIPDKLSSRELEMFKELARLHKKE